MNAVITIEPASHAARRGARAWSLRWRRSIIAAAPKSAESAASEAKEKTEPQNIDELRKDAPRVFIDGERLDLNYIKTEIQFVNYVRDRKEVGLFP